MANNVRPCGAIPKGALRRSNSYTAGGIIYPGDFVVTNSAGLVVVAAAGATGLLGASLTYASASGQTVMVADEPSQEFYVEASSAQINSATTLNLNYDIVASSGDTTYKVSRHKLDSSTGAVSATLQLKLLGIEARDNNALGGNVDCLVVINNHQLKGGTGTVGT